jgi:ornithine cyclodeaminase/alanine dehydrogenase-like protein (mu-crystallin family)
VTLLITAEEVRHALTETDLIEAICDSSRQRFRNQVSVPPRITADAADDKGWLRVGPALLNGSGYMGFKSMNRRPQLGVRYLVMLYSIESGELLALMDANTLTTARTAATNAIGTHLLAREDATTLGIVGSGFAARATLEQLLRLRELERVLVYSPRSESRDSFVEAIEGEHGISAAAADSAEAAVAESEIALLAFRAPSQPVFLASWLRPGMHVTGLSSVRPEAREVDDDTWTACDVVVVDDAGSVRQSGDGRSVAGDGELEYPELWQLVAGLVPGRTDPGQTTLFKSSGNSEQDIAAAAAVYRKAVDLGLGRDLGDFPEVKPYD